MRTPHFHLAAASLTSLATLYFMGYAAHGLPRWTRAPAQARRFSALDELAIEARLLAPGCGTRVLLASQVAEPIAAAP